MMKEHQLQMVTTKYMPLRDVVFNTLREAIITGEFEPGERLMEIALAEKLGVSRTPVREAIRKLELEGLVVMIPRRGAHVARITEKGLRDVLEIRTVLEEFAVGLACDRISPEGIRELKSLHRSFVASLDKGDNVTVALQDEMFHDAIFRAADNDRLLAILGNLREQFYRYRLEYLKDLPNYSNLISEHEDLVDAISGRDREKATSIMRRHLDNQKVAIIETLRKSDE